MAALVLILALFQSAQDIYTTANADFAAGRWADAAAKYEQVLKEDAKHIPSQFNLAVCRTKLGKTEEAIGAYKQLLDQDGTIYEARINLGLLLDQTGKRAEAGEQFEKALALRPDDAQAELNLGMFYMRGDEDKKAYPHLIAALQKGVATPDLYILLSEAEHSRNDEVKSREYLTKAAALDPGNTNIQRQLGISFFDEKNYAAAIPHLEQAVNGDPKDTDFLYMLGKSYEELKAYTQALPILQQVLQIKPDAVEAYATMGAIFYAQQDWVRAAQAMTRVTQLKPREAVGYFVLATCLDKLGNEKEALVQYNKFLQLDDGSNDARSFQARERARTLERRLKR
ncbi:MAG TPA: tetratricopeptide repeat protein [Terriglobia bacterium]|jgi:tetratricopeptide (TPR) repeat protein